MKEIGANLTITKELNILRIVSELDGKVQKHKYLRIILTNLKELNSGNCKMVKVTGLLCTAMSSLILALV